MSLFVHDWTVVSPLGVGRAAFGEAVRGWLERSEGLPWDGAAGPAPVFEGFDKKAYLGKKGVRGMDNLGAYATLASQLLVAGRPALAEEDRSKVGVVLGTGSGSLRVHVEFIRDLHVQERVEWVDPIQFPQTVINSAAGQVGIWHRFTGVNTTVSGGYHSGVTALQYAGNLFRNGRVELALAGCAEEFSPYSKYTFPVDARGMRERQRLGEGCALFLTAASRNNPSEAELFGLRRLAYLRGSRQERTAEELARLIDESLGSRGSLGRGLRRICFNGFSHREADTIGALQRRSAAASTARVWCSNALVADCLAATTGLQIALLLAAGAEEPRPPATDLAVTFDTAGGVAVTFIEQGKQV